MNSRYCGNRHKRIDYFGREVPYIESQRVSLQIPYGKGFQHPRYDSFISPVSCVDSPIVKVAQQLSALSRR